MNFILDAYRYAKDVGRRHPDGTEPDRYESLVKFDEDLADALREFFDCFNDESAKAADLNHCQQLARVIAMQPCGCGTAFGGCKCQAEAEG